MTREKSHEIRSQALQLIGAHGGVIRTREALAAGIHPRVLYELRDSGRLQKLAPGLYALANYSCAADVVEVTRKIPGCVVCLVSALYYHELTVQIPRQIDVAIPLKRKAPKIEYPPVRFYYLSEASFHLGIETGQVGGEDFPVYSREKTIVDCFRFRKKIGIEVAIEALRMYWEQGNSKLIELRRLASKLRVGRIMEPYLESLIHDQS